MQANFNEIVDFSMNMNYYQIKIIIFAIALKQN